jgi:formylglycine-generating enzyme required for sulfatase activity
VLASRRPAADVFASIPSGSNIDWTAPLRDYPARWQVLPQQVVPVLPTAVPATAPPGMVRVPGGRFDFRVSGVEIEGGDSAGVDVQYPWEEAPRRHHRAEIDVAPFFIDRHPVTNAEFKRFVDATGYRPPDPHNFLRHFVGKSYPEGWGNKPVTWVSLDDARAYAKWAGKRLPREWEWQLAAQGSDGRLYPWGNEWDGSAVPAVQTGRTLGPLPDVSAHPRGASAHGVMDLVGTVWQWTDEYADEHTRAAVIRGGSLYQPQGSRWYFPQAHRLDQHGKYLLMAPSLDRAGTIGFRCVVDATPRADTLGAVR